MFIPIIIIIFFLLFFLQKDTEIYQNARILEDFFDQLLEKWLPQYAFDAFDETDEPQSPEAKKRKKQKDNDPTHHIR